MNENMTISFAKYLQNNDVNTAVVATINGETMTVPLDPANRHYAEIQRQVAAGDLTIADAD
tara:strand:- start:3 stop:185 length:183 start_codon:yes stop_codon:yes gene_type:complete